MPLQQWQEEENDVPEPMVLEEVPVLVEEEEEQLVEDDNKRLPYQQTHFYQNELAHFDWAYMRWVNERYEQERGLFE